MTDDPLDSPDSWDLEVTTALHRAASVLDHASDAFAKGQATEEVVCGAVALAEAWRNLAEAWRDRQADAMALFEAEAEIEATETEQDAVTRG